MSVYFITSSQVDHRQVTLSGPLAHHLSKSLRIKNQEHILVNLDQKRLLVEITDVRQDEIIGQVVEEYPRPPGQVAAIHLGIALLKGEKMDWVIQKATELGVRTITPLITQHTVPRIQPTRMKTQLNRWNRIALEAAQQSEQWELTSIQPPEPFAKFIKTEAQETYSLLLSERGQAPGISDLTLPSQKEGTIRLVIGPEGGWSNQERELSKEQGLQSVSLGAEILKSETAALVAISLIQYRLGNLGGCA